MKKFTIVNIVKIYLRSRVEIYSSELPYLSQSATMKVIICYIFEAFVGFVLFSKPLTSSVVLNQFELCQNNQ